MSRRRGRAVLSDDDKGDPAPLLPPAARRPALPLSQATGGGTNALAALLALSQPAAAPSAGDSRPSRGPARGRGASTRPGKPDGLPLSAPAAAAGSQGLLAAGTGQLWVEKHAPRGAEDLVVHKKKVQEAREWLQQQHASLGRPGVRRLLVVTGPPGCGKSTLLAVLAAAQGFAVSEWRPPSAVGWEEAQHAGMQRRSKLEEFDEFVARTKLPHLSLRSSSGDVQRQPASAAAPSAQPASAAAPLSQRPGRLPPSLLPTLVLVDDLPHAAGAEQRRQVAAALADLAAGARFPVVLLATEASGKAQQERGLSAAAGGHQGLHKYVASVLEAAGAATLSLNPFTPLSIAKALRCILERERLALPEADLQAVAEQAGGDLRSAIAALQFVCTGAAAAPPPAAKPRRRGTKRKAGPATAAAAAAGDAAVPSRVGFAQRDGSLSLFHALGKLLYNKRLPAAASQQQQNTQQQQQPGAASQPAGAGALPATSQQQQQQSSQSQQADGTQPWQAHRFWEAAAGGAAPGLPLAAWAQRPPMDFDPEAVLAAAGLEAGSVAAFLHENVLHFIEDGAMEDAAGCLEQLSTADALAAGRRWGSSDAYMGDEDMASSTLLDAAAASTAARGVCFHNAHPAPRRFLPLKAPSLFAAAKGAAANGAELSRNTAAAWAVRSGTGCLQPSGWLAAELLPFVRAMAGRSPDHALQHLLPARWMRYWGGQLHEQPGGSGPRLAWRQEQQEAADGGGQQAAAPPEDAIEESEDEDDW